LLPTNSITAAPSTLTISASISSRISHKIAPVKLKLPVTRIPNPTYPSNPTLKHDWSVCSRCWPGEVIYRVVINRFSDIGPVCLGIRVTGLQSMSGDLPTRTCLPMNSYSAYRTVTSHVGHYSDSFILERSWRFVNVLLSYLLNRLFSLLIQCGCIVCRSVALRLHACCVLG